MKRFTEQIFELLTVFIELTFASSSSFLAMPLSVFHGMIRTELESFQSSKEEQATSSKGKQIEDPLVVEPINEISKIKTETDEPIGVCSLDCSENDADRTSDKPKVGLKRKSRELDGSEGPRDNEDVENGPSKINRAAERKRSRDRMNEKLRDLEELIPNCTKDDTITLLDETFEYMKKLEHEFQIMKTITANSYKGQMMHPSLVHLLLGGQSASESLSTILNKMKSESKSDVDGNV